METDSNETHAELLVEMQVAQLDRGGDRADRHLRTETLIDLAGLQAAIQVAFEAKLASSGRDIQHHTLDR
ncbi:hypothetical protein D3C84_1164920 [compost metagenome]